LSGIYEEIFSDLTGSLIQSSLCFSSD